MTNLESRVEEFLEWTKTVKKLPAGERPTLKLMLTQNIVTFGHLINKMKEKGYITEEEAVWAYLSFEGTTENT